jgi:hypothetical protein
MEIWRRIVAVERARTLGPAGLRAAAAKALESKSVGSGPYLLDRCGETAVKPLQGPLLVRPDQQQRADRSESRLLRSAGGRLAGAG